MIAATSALVLVLLTPCLTRADELEPAESVAKGAGAGGVIVAKGGKAAAGAAGFKTGGAAAAGFKGAAAGAKGGAKGFASGAAGFKKVN